MEICTVELKEPPNWNYGAADSHKRILSTYLTHSQCATKQCRCFRGRLREPDRLTYSHELLITQIYVGIKNSPHMPNTEYGPCKGYRLTFVPRLDMTSLPT